MLILLLYLYFGGPLCLSVQYGLQRADFSVEHNDALKVTVVEGEKVVVDECFLVQMALAEKLYSLVVVRVYELLPHFDFGHNSFV